MDDFEHDDSNDAAGNANDQRRTKRASF